MGLIAISISLVRCLLRSFAHFQIGLSVFLLSFSSFYVFDTSS